MSNSRPAAVPLRDYERHERNGQSNGDRRSLFSLFKLLPSQLSRLVRDELRAAQAELTAKAKAAGVGAGLVAGGAILALFAFGAIIASAILALSLVVPGWLAALIVAVALLLVAGILAFVGQKKLKEGIPPVPEESIDSVKADIRAVKGTNR